MADDFILLPECEVRSRRLLVSVRQLTSRITAAQIQLAVAIALGLAATNFFYLGVTTTQTAQVNASINSADSAPDDTIDAGSSASWQCAGVPIAVQCGTAR